MPEPDTNQDAPVLGLRTLVWTLAEPDRAIRLLDLTGLTPSDLKAAAGEPATLAAVIAFLESHEPDLTAAAGDLGVTPAALVAAREELERIAWGRC